MPASKATLSSTLTPQGHEGAWLNGIVGPVWTALDYTKSLLLPETPKVCPFPSRNPVPRYLRKLGLRHYCLPSRHRVRYWRKAYYHGSWADAEHAGACSRPIGNKFPKNCGRCSRSASRAPATLLVPAAEHVTAEHVTVAHGTVISSSRIQDRLQQKPLVQFCIFMTRAGYTGHDATASRCRFSAGRAGLGASGAS